MGWTWTYKPKGVTATDFLLNSSGTLKWGEDNPYRYTVLDTSIVNLRTFYAAVEQVHKETGERRVWAAVFLLGYVPKARYENFGWKDMDESMGPCEARCPERILDLLTETEYGHAKDWRARCRTYHADRKAKLKIEPGFTVKLHGRDYQVLEKQRGGFRVLGVEDGTVYRLTHAKARQCTEVRAP